MHPHLTPSDFGLPNDPSRPVLSDLSNAFVSNLGASFRILSKAATAAKSKRKLTEAQIKQQLAEAFEFLEKANELLGWIYPSTSALSVDVGIEIANRMKDARCPPEWVEATIREIGKKKEGRPATKRSIAIRVKEMKLANPKRWTWSKVTAEVCDCRKTIHDFRCQDNLRREILHLDRTLKRLGCSIRPGKNLR